MLYLLARTNKCILVREDVFSFDLSDPVAAGAVCGGKLSQARRQRLPAGFEESLGLAAQDVDFPPVVWVPPRAS
jgi:hypothetical protein